MNYNAPLDKLAKVITVSTIILFVGLSIVSIQALALSNGKTSELILHSLTLLLFVGIPFVCFMYAPKSYKIETDALLVLRTIGNLRIPFSTIKSFGKPEITDMAGTIRMVGVGGLFGYFGRFRNPKIGPMFFYATQRKNWILIETDEGKKIIVTPDDSDNFIAELRRLNIM